MNAICKFLLLIFICSIGFSYSLSAQNVLKELSKESGVVLSYKWKSLKEKKDKGLELCLELNNNNDYPVEVEFSFEILRNKEQKSKSPEIKKCLKPHKVLRGRKKDLNYLIADLTFTDVKSDLFELLVKDMEVKQVAKCKK